MKPAVCRGIEAGKERAPHMAPHEEDEAMHGIRRGLMRIGAAALALAMMATTAAAQSRTSGPFTGVKANTGAVTLSTSGKSQVLTLSEDFKAPDAPDPHWQVVDSHGRVYLLQKLTVKGLVGDKMNRSITLPAYIADVAKVQFWCAYAEVLLGEASFSGNYSTH
jgi:hypothetical protein